jgi:tetratricopeptide (TPR) repeat protein
MKAWAVFTRVLPGMLAVVLAVVGWGGSGCHRAAGSPAGIPGPVASALLAFAAEQGIPPAEAARAWARIEEIAATVSPGRPGSGTDGLDRLNTVIFGDLGFVREIERADATFLLLPSVVAGRRGSCVGLSALYLTVGERLGIPLDGVLVPGHFFVRRRGPQARNVELLRGGQDMPDAWYLEKYGPWDAAASAYMRPLTIAEVIAVHWFNVGNQRRAGGDVLGSIEAYGRAVDEFPAFAEAAASLGAVEHLQGDLRAAEVSYRAAARARPDLPGMTHNLSLLEAERSAPSPDSHSETTKSQRRDVPRRSLP